MKLINLISRINRLFPRPPVHTEQERKARERRIILRYARGQPSLYLGRYILTEDIEKRKAKLGIYNFLT